MAKKVLIIFLLLSYNLGYRLLAHIYLRPKSALVGKVQGYQQLQEIPVFEPFSFIFILTKIIRL